nr:hypothetical protein CFP56_16892 [Quercus suber]
MLSVQQFGGSSTGLPLRSLSWGKWIGWLLRGVIRRVLRRYRRGRGIVDGLVVGEGPGQSSILRAVVHVQKGRADRRARPVEGDASFPGGVLRSCSRIGPEGFLEAQRPGGSSECASAVDVKIKEGTAVGMDKQGVGSVECKPNEATWVRAKKSTSGERHSERMRVLCLCETVEQPEPCDRKVDGAGFLPGPTVVGPV